MECEVAPLFFHSLDCGNGPPDVKQKHTKQKASQEMLGVTVGLAGGKPTMSANASFTRGASETLESADEKPMPKCDMRWDVGKSWQGPEKDYDCYDVSWWPVVSNRQGITNEMCVDFGLGMNILPNKLYTPGLPQISSILRNQIMIWVSDPTSPAKGHGILVLTSMYIPNIRTNDTLTIYESISANLANNPSWVDDPPTAFENATTHNAAMSVSVAALHRPDTRKISGVLHKLRKLVKSSSSSGSKGKTVLELPLYDAVSRGWDATNQRWKNVVWPSLNSKFQPLDGKDPAVWKLDWKTSTADREVKEVPANITTPTSGEPMPTDIGIEHRGPGSVSGSSADGRTAAGDVLVALGYETASTSATAFESSAHIPVLLITKPGLENGEIKEMTDHGPTM
ncbi:hypothetical protein B0H10DRAFT_413024 [Mycena sp. CBHHK59/15]|nr:hypothetical protein B0H10DRAFT_413024 [Mycena sp. CBHHK59/15]